MSRKRAIAAGTLLGVCGCYVLEDGTRVLPKRTAMSLISDGAESGHYDRAVSRLPKRFRHLATVPKLAFVRPGGGVALGIPAEHMVEVCHAYVDALVEGELRASQVHLAKGAQKFLRAVSTVGIIALVVEATGYEAERPDGELERIFRIQTRDWDRVFDDGLVRRLCELGCAGERYLDWSGGRFPRPLAATFGEIYRLVLGAGAYAELKQRNPEPGWGHNHHQWLTDEALEALKQHLGLIRFCAWNSTSKEHFREQLRAFYASQHVMAFHH